MKMSYALLLFYLGLVGIGFAVPPTVSNIRASQHAGTKIVDVRYDVADPDSATLTVQVEISSDSGATYDLPVHSVSGAVGAGVTPGTNRLLQWNAGNDWNGNFSSQCRVRLWAFDNSAPVPPLGMVYVPPGTFRMGWDNVSSIGGDVTLTKGYYMDRYETSGNLWTVVKSWALGNGYGALSGSFSADNHPVVNVTWYDAVRWCNARSQKEGLTPCYYSDVGLTTVIKTGNIVDPYVKWNANGYRIPTEAEWERAARGGLDRKVYPWGDTIVGSQANFVLSGDPFDNGTTPVGYFNGSQTPAGVNMANGYGLYDMAGNVHEWCWDYLNGLPPYGQTDPTGAPNGYRMIRGGSYQDSIGAMRLSSRSFLNPNGVAVQGVGFRCVRGL